MVGGMGRTIRRAAPRYRRTFWRYSTKFREQRPSSLALTVATGTRCCSGFRPSRRLRLAPSGSSSSPKCSHSTRKSTRDAQPLVAADRLRGPLNSNVERTVMGDVGLALLALLFSWAGWRLHRRTGVRYARFEPDPDGNEAADPLLQQLRRHSHRVCDERGRSAAGPRPALAHAPRVRSAKPALAALDREAFGRAHAGPHGCARLRAVGLERARTDVPAF